MTEKMLSLRVPMDLYDKVAASALESGMTVSVFIRETLVGLYDSGISPDVVIQGGGTVSVPSRDVSSDRVPVERPTPNEAASMLKANAPFRAEGPPAVMGWCQVHPEVVQPKGFLRCKVCSSTLVPGKVPDDYVLSDKMRRAALVSQEINAKHQIRTSEAKDEMMKGFLKQHG